MINSENKLIAIKKEDNSYVETVNSDSLIVNNNENILNAEIVESEEVPQKDDVRSQQ